jgi:hypothetical protein
LVFTTIVVSNKFTTLVVKKMARKGLKFLNALAIVSIVFVCVTAIPLGILVGLSLDDGAIKDNQSLTIDANGYVILDDISRYDVYGLIYWVEASSDVKVRFFVLDDYDYSLWNTTESIVPPAYDRTYNLHEKSVFIHDISGYIVLVNENNAEIEIGYHYIVADDLLIPIMILGVIFGLFLTILLLNTLGYFIKGLIIIPITGGKALATTDPKRRNGYYYSYETKPAAKPAAPKVEAKPGSPTPPAAPKPAVKPTPRKPPVPAIDAISQNYVVADQEKQYTHSRGFVNQVSRVWDQTSIPERVLGILALFFFLTGLVTVTWYLIVVLPLVLIGVAVVVFFSVSSRREKLVSIVKSHKAIYVQDAARLLNTSTDFIRSDAWKIVRLGLGPIGFDAERNVLFDVTQVDPSVSKDLSPAAQTIHTQLVAEVEKKEEVKEEKVVSQEPTLIKCPFCEREDNPSDSSFCIGCGASLKPAK